MKKFSKIFAMVAIALVAFCSLVACRNNAGGSGGNGSSVIIEFVSWPQTIKAATVNVDKDTSEKREVGMFTYYKGSDGEWYCEAQENAYQANYTYSDGTTSVAQASAGSSKWFKVEPIKWRVLANNYNGKKLLFAESGLYASVCYYDVNNVDRKINGKTVSPNNYEHSKIRAWLNGLSYVYKSFHTNDAEPKEEYNGKGFLHTAFTAEERAKIAETVVDNSEASTGVPTNSYVCDNTNDKVFLLSVSEAFNNAYFADNSTRIRNPTDFALANYAAKSSNAAYGGWFFVRSPSYGYGRHARRVRDDGGAYSNDVSNQSGVVVPALCVD